MTNPDAVRSRVEDAEARVSRPDDSPSTGGPGDGLRLAFFYRDYLHGGAYPRDTRLLAEALIPHVASVTVYCYVKRPQDEGERTVNGVTVHSSYLVPHLWARNAFTLPRALRERLDADRERLDLVTLIGAFVPENVPVARRLRRLGVPYAVSPGEPVNAFALSSRGVKGARKRLYARWLEREVFQHAEGVQVCSVAHGSHLARMGFRVDPGTLFVGREAIDWETVLAEREASGPSPATAQELEDLGEEPRFGFLGRLRVFHKGLDVLIEAWSIYRLLGGPGSLTLVGPASRADRARLDHLVERYRVPDVRILPPKRGVEKYAFLESLSALVHPSRHDGITRVVREGLASRRPLITTYATHIYELLQRHGGGYVCGLDAVDLAMAMKRFADRTPEQDARLRAGIEAVVADLTWEAGAQQFLLGARQVLRARGRRGTPA